MFILLLWTLLSEYIHICLWASRHHLTLCVSVYMHWATVTVRSVIKHLFHVLFFCCIYRDSQSGSHGRRDVVAGKHQSNGLLQSELRPPQLETSHSTADDQPNGISFFHLCQSFWLFSFHPKHFQVFLLSRFFRFLILLITSCCILNVCAVLSRQIISVGNRAGLIDDVFNLARWVQFVIRPLWKHAESFRESDSCTRDQFNSLQTPAETPGWFWLIVSCFLLSQ